MLIMLLFVVAISCKKDEEEPFVITRVEYRIDSNVDNSIVKYIDAKGMEQIDFIVDKDSTWVYSFDWVKELDSVGFKIKDYITWTTYRIVINTDTVVAYQGVVPDGDPNDQNYYSVYYKIPKE